MKIIFIRGGPAVGKTTLTKQILKILKLEHQLDCAYIAEDNFRKEMQNKYKAKDIQVHRNSVKLITNIIKQLTKMDSYDFIFIEGQFRYQEIINSYEQFVKENNYSAEWIEFSISTKEMKERDNKLRNTKSKDIDEVKKDIDSNKPLNYKIMITNKTIEENANELINLILSAQN